LVATERKRGCDWRDLAVFDVHTHAFPDEVAARAMPKLTAAGVWFDAAAHHDGTLGGLLASMDRAGIARAVVCSIATRPAQGPKITAWSRSVASERIVPFGSIHPDAPDVEGEAERIAAAGLKGVKFHPHYMRCPIDDPRSVRVARACAGAGLAMVYHTGHDLAFEKDELAPPAGVRRLHEAVPELRLVAAHMGGWQRWDEALEHVAGLPVYLETSMTMGRCPVEVLERLIEAHPPEYLLFGTDAPWADQAEEVSKLRALGLEASLERRVLWENAVALTGTAAWP